MLITAEIEALTLLAETREAQSDVLSVKCNLCKSQVSIMLGNSEVYMINKSWTL